MNPAANCFIWTGRNQIGPRLSCQLLDSTLWIPRKPIRVSGLTVSCAVKTGAAAERILERAHKRAAELQRIRCGLQILEL
jgi:hypothetical protein